MNPNINAESVLRDGVMENGIATIEDVTFDIEKKQSGRIIVTISDKNGKVMWFESEPHTVGSTFTIGPFHSMKFEVEVVAT